MFQNSRTRWNIYIFNSESAFYLQVIGAYCGLGCHGPTTDARFIFNIYISNIWDNFVRNQFIYCFFIFNNGQKLLVWFQSRWLMEVMTSMNHHLFGNVSCKLITVNFNLVLLVLIGHSEALCQANIKKLKKGGFIKISLIMQA